MGQMQLTSAVTKFQAPALDNPTRRAAGYIVWSDASDYGKATVKLPYYDKTSYKDYRKYEFKGSVNRPKRYSGVATGTVENHYGEKANVTLRFKDKDSIQNPDRDEVFISYHPKQTLHHENKILKQHFEGLAWGAPLFERSYNINQ